MASCRWHGRPLGAFFFFYHVSRSLRIHFQVCGHRYRGVVYRPKVETHPYGSCFRGCHLGSFGTALEAAVAYAKAVEESRMNDAIAGNAKEDHDGDGVEDEEDEASENDEMDAADENDKKSVQQTPMDFTARDDDALNDNGHRRVANGGAATQAAAQDTHAVHDEELDDEEEEEQQQQQVGVVVEAQGLQLHISHTSSTGYRGVYLRPNGRFEARINQPGTLSARRKSGSWLGVFDTAVEAAVAVARCMLSAPSQPPLPRSTGWHAQDASTPSQVPGEQQRPDDLLGQRVRVWWDNDQG